MSNILKTVRITSMLLAKNLYCDSLKQHTPYISTNSTFMRKHDYLSLMKCAPVIPVSNKIPCIDLVFVIKHASSTTPLNEKPRIDLIRRLKYPRVPSKIYRLVHDS